jgi:hypothetical protein
MCIRTGTRFYHLGSNEFLWILRGFISTQALKHSGANPATLVSSASTLDRKWKPASADRLRSRDFSMSDSIFVHDICIPAIAFQIGNDTLSNRKVGSPGLAENTMDLSGLSFSTAPLLTETRPAGAA